MKEDKSAIVIFILSCPSCTLQFLAMQSSSAVPMNVNQIARRHSGVTLLFMDIKGFTSMAQEVRAE